MIDSWAKEEEEEPKANKALRAASWDDASQTGANPSGGNQRNLGDLRSRPECARLQTGCHFFVAVGDYGLL